MRPDRQEHPRDDRRQRRGDHHLQHRLPPARAQRVAPSRRLFGTSRIASSAERITTGSIITAERERAGPRREPPAALARLQPERIDEEREGEDADHDRRHAAEQLRHEPHRARPAGSCRYSLRSIAASKPDRDRERRGQRHERGAADERVIEPRRVVVGQVGEERARHLPRAHVRDVAEDQEQRHHREQLARPGARRS